MGTVNYGNSGPWANVWEWESINVLIHLSAADSTISRERRGDNPRLRKWHGVAVISDNRYCTLIVDITVSVHHSTAPGSDDCASTR